MINNNYELRIISNEQSSEGKVLKKYIIDEQETIGVVENEPFEIEFKNKTWAKIQVRISVDGTDISTGDLASTKPDGVMWFVEPYGVLKLKAWPESAKGGAEFLFGKTEDSVAENTHGNMSGKGIIAAAVFVEGYSPYVNYGFQNRQLTGIGNISLSGNFGPFNHNIISSNEISLNARRSKSVENNTSGSLRSYDTSSASLNIAECSENLAVGAGEYVAQEIVKVAGLTQPKLDTTISVKYESWNSLRSKVRALQKQVVNVSNPAFPGDAPMKMIDLKNTPRKNKPKKPTRTPDLQRF